MPETKNRRKSGGKKHKKQEGQMAKFPKPLDFQGVDIQVAQGVVNHYKGLLQVKDKELNEFGAQVHTDMKRLVEEVEGLSDRLTVSDDGYEVMELEPGDE